MKVIAIGDSCCYGQNVRADQAWPAVLARLTGWDVRNEGVCGDTTRLGLERFPKAVQLHKPDAVVIQYGHNDANIWETDNGLPRVSAEGYLANIIEMVDRAIASGASRVRIIGPHQAYKSDRGYNARLADYVSSIDAPTILLAPVEVSLLHDGYGVHPDKAMHERIAIAVQEALADDLAPVVPLRRRLVVDELGYGS